MTKRKAKKAAAAPERRPLDAEALRLLCSHIAGGDSLSSWARNEGYAKQTISDWVLADPDRVKAYREARRMQADAHVDDLIDLADEEMPLDAQGRTDSAMVQRQRTRIDTRKWIASKYHPALYGDKVDVNATIRGADQKPEEVLAKMAALLAANGLRISKADDEP